MEFFVYWREFSCSHVAQPEERGRVQGIADLMTTATVAIASLTAGGCIASLGNDGTICIGTSVDHCDVSFMASDVAHATG